MKYYIKVQLLECHCNGTSPVKEPITIQELDNADMGLAVLKEVLSGYRDRTIPSPYPRGAIFSVSLYDQRGKILASGKVSRN